MQDDPPYLPVGTAVSAKYKGAFCEAKVSKVVRVVKCKITYKMGLGTATVTDEQIRGPLRVGHPVQAKHSDKKEFVDASIMKIQDCSQYTVVFDDGDIMTLRRSALCLKSGRHFNESETLDQLPLTHPEHFGNPVVGGRRGRRSRQHKEDSSDGEGEEEIEPDLEQYSGDIGKVVCVESSDKKKSRDNWFPGLVVVPSAQPTVRINVREEYLIRSFKDGRYYTVPKKEVQDFSREMGSRIESTALSEAMEKALKYLDRHELPAHWERSALFDQQIPDSDSEENYTDSSDDEPREEKDHFVAQLYKFMDDRGTPLNKSPMISNRDVDLYRLFRLVHKIGGYNRVTNQNKWKSVTVRLGYSHNHTTYNSVKQAYKKYLFSFEDFYRKLGCTMINHPRNAKKNRGRNLIRDRDRATPVNSSPRPERSEDSSEPLDKKEDSEKSDQDTVKLKPKMKQEVLKPKMLEREFESEKVKRKELIEMSDSSSNSSDIVTDTPPEPVPSTSKEVKKEEVRKKVDVKPVKERKIKVVPSGEKVKALVEKFEEQSKKEEMKSEDDKAQQTRSKQPPRKEAPSPERRDTRTPLRDPIKTSKPKKQEEDKKRGRKRKDTESEKSSPSETTTPEPSSSTQPVGIGDKLKVYYGPTHESKVTYEAKVLEIERDNTGTIYLVHYTGWNTRYDEWIKPARIAENLSLTTKAKRLKQSQTPGKSSSSNKPPAKRGRGMSVSSRSQEPPRSTTPSSVTSSSSRTKSPATPASKSFQRVTRQGELGRRTRRTSAHTDLSVPSESDTELSESESELTRTRSGSKTDDPKDDRPSFKRRLNQKRKDDDDDEKDSETEKPKRLRKIKAKSEAKANSTESDEDSSSPPKGRDFDLNQIRSELKGFEKAVKIPPPESSETAPEDKPVVEVKAPLVEKKVEEKPKPEKPMEKAPSTEDIYEFKEPEPFEFEARNTKLNEDKSVKKRLVPRVIDELDKCDKSPKKKGGKSPPKVEAKDQDLDKKRPFKKTPVKKTEEEEDKPKTDSTPIKMSTLEDPFDKLVESPSFNIGLALDKKPQVPMLEPPKPKLVKTLNLDEPINLFQELPVRIEEDSEDHLDLSDMEDTPNEPLFTHKGPRIIDSAFLKTSESPGMSIFRGFTDKSDDSDKKNSKDGTSDEDDPIDAAIQRVISHTITDEDSTDELFITQPTNIYQPKLKIKEEIKPVSPIKEEIDSVNEPLDIDVDSKDAKPIVKESTTSKQISPALQETDSSLLEAISLQTEMLKKEELRETPIRTGPKIADSILQKFNMYKKKEEIKPAKVEIKAEIKIEKPEIKKEIVPEEIKEVEEVKPEEIEIPPEIKKRPSKKFMSKEFIEESDTDSSDSEQRLVIAPMDEDSQTNASDKLDFKDTDSNNSVLQATDDSQEAERNFKFEEAIKSEPEPPESTIESIVKTEVTDAAKQEEEPDSNLSMLFCKETIPGSPAPAPEVQASSEPRVKPKSAKSLLLEMPFASAPGSSNNKGMMTAQVEHKSQQKVSNKQEIQPLAIPLEQACERAEVAAVLDNTPPTTPESTISNLSPRRDQDRISPNTADNESCKSTDSGPKTQPSKVPHFNEEDTLLASEPIPAAKKPVREETAAPCKKRRRSCKPPEDILPKRGRRPNMRGVRANSDSDDTSEHSAPGTTPPASSSMSHSISVPGESRLSRSPRPSKYNFIIELDQSLDSAQRIALLQQKLSELRKTYNNVKTELACIDRRRKKLRRREREALKAAKQEMACS